jgi:hypothetical protein
MIASAYEQLKGLWIKATVASDTAERESLLFQFRDFLHENLEQLREETKDVPQWTRLG